MKNRFYLICANIFLMFISFESVAGFGSYRTGLYYGRYSGHRSTPYKLTWFDGLVFLLVILFTVGMCYFGIVYFKKIKAKKADKLIKLSAEEDKIWEKEHLVNVTKHVFREFRNAWQEQDLSIINHLVTNHLIEREGLILSHQIDKNIVNFINIHSIDNVEIIGIQDSKNDYFDKFSAYVSATISEHYTYGGVVNEGSKKTGKIEEILHFVRVKNEWLLDSIQNDTSVNGLSLVKNFKE